MLRFVLSTCLVAASLGQLVDHKEAKILKEQRFNAGDGRHGAAFAQEDGTVFREESTADGERVGQYSYVDQAGKTITVRYTAGKDGFKILEGAHVPTGANGQSSAPFRAEAPAAQVQAAPRPSAPVQVSAPVVQQPDYDYYEAEPVSVQRNANPFINPHDPTHRDFRFNQNGANFGPQGVLPNAGHVPACANCEGLNPFVNPFDQSHQQTPNFAPVATPAPFRAQQAAPVQRVQPAFNLRQQQQPITQAPRRNFPPGQLSLNRFETGFNFDFTSQ